MFVRPRLLRRARRAMWQPRGEGGGGARTRGRGAAGAWPARGAHRAQAAGTDSRSPASRLQPAARLRRGPAPLQGPRRGLRSSPPRPSAPRAPIPPLLPGRRRGPGAAGRSASHVRSGRERPAAGSGGRPGSPRGSGAFRRGVPRRPPEQLPAPYGGACAALRFPAAPATPGSDPKPAPPLSREQADSERLPGSEDPGGSRGRLAWRAAPRDRQGSAEDSGGCVRPALAGCGGGAEAGWRSRARLVGWDLQKRRCADGRYEARFTCYFCNTVNNKNKKLVSVPWKLHLPGSTAAPRRPR